jgi:RND superfamily putative drug exporter
VQVAGHPLPSEGAAVARLVALEDVGGSDRAEVRVGVAEVLIERMRLTQPWYRIAGQQRRVHSWLARINSVLGADSVGAHSTIDQLAQLPRAVALAAVALAEHTPVIMLDQLDAFADPRDEAAFLRALDSLAPATTTIVLGTPVAPRDFEMTGIGRDVLVLDLAAIAFDRKGALS